MWAQMFVIVRQVGEERDVINVSEEQDPSRYKMLLRLHHHRGLPGVECYDASA